MIVNVQEAHIEDCFVRAPRRGDSMDLADRLKLCAGSARPPCSGYTDRRGLSSMIPATFGHICFMHCEDLCLILRSPFAHHNPQPSPLLPLPSPPSPPPTHTTTAAATTTERALLRLPSWWRRPKFGRRNKTSKNHIPARFLISG